MAKKTKTELENNAEDVKYKVGKGSITYKPNGYSLSKIIVPTFLFFRSLIFPNSLIISISG